eukprot:6176915-Pleurochrysis_carterae.AAC.1
MLSHCAPYNVWPRRSNQTCSTQSPARQPRRPNTARGGLGGGLAAERHGTGESGAARSAPVLCSDLI